MGIEPPTALRVRTPPLSGVGDHTAECLSMHPAAQRAWWGCLGPTRVPAHADAEPLPLKTHALAAASHLNITKGSCFANLQGGGGEGYHAGAPAVGAVRGCSQVQCGRGGGVGPGSRVPRSLPPFTPTHQSQFLIAFAYCKCTLSSPAGHAIFRNCRCEARAMLTCRQLRTVDLLQDGVSDNASVYRG